MRLMQLLMVLKTSKFRSLGLSLSLSLSPVNNDLPNDRNIMFQYTSYSRMDIEEQSCSQK